MIIDNGILVALMAGITSVVVTLITTSLSEAHFKETRKLDYTVEKLIVKFLKSSRYKVRKFETIKTLLGGFEDNELRKILVRSGAVRKYIKEIEHWGLYEKNKNSTDDGVI